MESHCIWLSESRWIANFSILMTSCLFDVSNCILSTPRWVCLKNQDSFSFLSIPAFSLDSWLLKLLSEFNLSTGYVHHCTSICILCIYIYVHTLLVMRLELCAPKNAGVHCSNHQRYGCDPFPRAPRKSFGGFKSSYYVHPFPKWRRSIESPAIR
jgi:hypothetical protein